MADYGFEPYSAEPEPDPPTSSRLPGGISPQTAAAVLLIAIVLATLYLFFGPLPDDGAAVPATPTALVSAATSARPSAAATGNAAGGLSVATPSPATMAGVATVPIGTPLGAPTSSTPSILGASAATPLPGAGSVSGTIAIGAFVTVNGVGTDGLRYRMGAGADNLTIRIVSEGETFKILGGPETADGTVFWRVQDARGNVGWAAEPFLAPSAAPSGWNPPVASPTFEADAAPAP